jgi:excisionase family DNA binding protein
MSLDGDALALLARRLEPWLYSSSKGLAGDGERDGRGGHQDDDDRLLTGQEAAQLLGVSDRYVGRLGREGALERVEVGRKYVRYPRSAVIAFAKSGRSRRQARQIPAAPTLATAGRPTGLAGREGRRRF